MKTADNREIGWDDPQTVFWYEKFCRYHDRYAAANVELVAQADLTGAPRILDFAAGTGRTSTAAFDGVGEPHSILCVEPSAAMAAVGRRRLKPRNVAWTNRLPTQGRFDRILCNAAIWQIELLDEFLIRMQSLLRPGGALAFNMPALYLGEPDEAGGGADPLLMDLLAVLAAKYRSKHVAQEVVTDVLTIERLESSLVSAGLTPRRWEFRRRFSQPALRDWLKIPVLTNGLLGGLDAEGRAAIIDAAYSEVDPRSWRWERWLGWTASKTSRGMASE